MDDSIDPLLTSYDVRRQMGDITPMTLWRWMRDPRVNFPAPDMIINQPHFWRRSSFANWQQRMAAPREQEMQPTC